MEMQINEKHIQKTTRLFKRSHEWRISIEKQQQPIYIPLYMIKCMQIYIRQIYLGGHSSPFVAKFSVEFDDDPLFFRRKGTFFEMRPQMISPSQPTTLPTPHQPGILLHSIPIPFSMLLHVLHQDGILGSGPWALFEAMSTDIIRPDTDAVGLHRDGDW